MTEKDWAKVDYDFNKTRRKLISALKKLDKELQLSSTITGDEHDAFWCLIFHVRSRYDYASLNWKIMQKEGKNEYKEKVKELEDAIAKCEKAEKEFKSRTCKFRSPINCDFCTFHSDCKEHWKEGDENG